MRLSNELPASAFYTNPKIRVAPFSTPDIVWYGLTSPYVRLDVGSAGDIGLPTTSEAVTLVAIMKDAEIAGLLFKSLLLVQLRRTQQEVLAETWLESVYEYGTGQEDEEALMDLIASLGEYLDALEAREKKLGDSARHELETLHKLIRRKS